MQFRIFQLQFNTTLFIFLRFNIIVYIIYEIKLLCITIFPKMNKQQIFGYMF